MEGKQDVQWKKKLTPEQYRILRKKGTEIPFTGKYYKLKENGMYACAGCGQELFSSDAKFDSGTGWPSFSQPIAEKKVLVKEDTSMLMQRREVVCSTCGGHLGHVFDDGPQPTGKRFCINSASLEFKKKKEK